MGQYYRIVNIDKKEVMRPFDFGNGMKLMEWSYARNYMVLALMNLLSDEWQGDRVYVIGDYADNEDPEECWAPTFVAIGDPDIYQATDDWLQRVPTDHSICAFRESFANTEDTSIEDWHWRFIYNRATKQVIDLEKCPIEWAWYDKEAGEVSAARVSPLSLLLTMEKKSLMKKELKFSKIPFESCDLENNMNVYLERKNFTGYHFEEETIEFDDVISYDTHGATDDGPVFQFYFANGTRGVFLKRDWNAFVQEWRELE